MAGSQETYLGVDRKPRSLSARSVSSPRARSVANQVASSSSVSSSRPQSSPSVREQSLDVSETKRVKSESSLRTELLEDSFHTVHVKSAEEGDKDGAGNERLEIFDILHLKLLDEAPEESALNKQDHTQANFEEQLANLHRDIGQEHDGKDSGIETDLTFLGAPEDNETIDTINLDNETIDTINLDKETIDTINLSEYQAVESSSSRSQSEVTLRASSLQNSPRPQTGATGESLGYFSAATPPTGVDRQDSVLVHQTAPYEVLSLFEQEDCSQPHRVMPDPNKCLVVVVGVVVVLVAIPIAALINSYHKINEGHVGIYFKYGALQDTLTYPGVHFMTPFVSEYQEILIRPVTNTMEPFKAVTKDGIENTFRSIQIITRIKVDQLIETVKKFGVEFKDALVYDRVKEELRKFSANHTIHEVYNTMFLQIVDEVKGNVEDSLERLGEDALEILNLVIPKPEIPSDIAHNYRQVKVQWTEQLVATQQQKTEKIKKETESIRALADAERNKAVLEIKIKEKILDKEGEQTISEINNSIVKAQQENVANIDKYKVEKEAEANTKLYTGEYVKLNLAKELAKNTKFYFSGDQSVLGGLLNNILKDQ